MKVNEAEKKWCPFADSGYIWNGLFGNPEKDAISPKCLTSNCMAWVYTKEYEAKAFKDSEYNVDYFTDKPKFGKPLEESDKEGYCQRLKSGS